MLRLVRVAIVRGGVWRRNRHEYFDSEGENTGCEAKRGRSGNLENRLAMDS